MIPIYDAKSLTKEQILTRSIVAEENVETAVAEIIAAVRARGDQALYEYSRKFDRAELTSLEVTKAEIDEAIASLDPDFLETLRIAHENIETFHRRQVRDGFEIAPRDGVVLGQRFTPIERVGLYVPGGTAAYPSTVLMDATPAAIAGVKDLIMVTPPSPEGKIKAELLAAARIAGVTHIFRIGGAQAVAALAYGTESVPKVDKIVGPGNIYVATAKRRVFGVVAIDMIAGPSEITVVADEKSDPAFVAADLLSQAEHDRLASAVLVTPSRALAEKVQTELERQLKLLPREEIARTSVEDNGKILIVDTMEEAFDIANTIAPEHLEVCADTPEQYLPLIKNAGSIFLGRYAPEALGDYMAGTNHTLPTSGTARFSSPLSVDDFVKKSSYLSYTAEALGKIAPRIADFARREGLEGHARSALVRFNPEAVQ